MNHSVAPIPAKPYGSEGGVIFLPSTVRVKDGAVYVGHQLVDADSAVVHARALLSAVAYATRED